MSRTGNVTLGFLLIFIGLQLNLVQTFTLNSGATKFWAERIATPEDLAPLRTVPVATNGFNYNNNPFSQASYSNGIQSPIQPAASSIFLRPKQITPPDWICWPVIFIGAFLVLQGAILKR